MKNAEQGDQLSIDSDIVDRKGRIELTDVCRQFLRFEAWKDQEKVHLQSCDAQRSRWQKLLMDTTKGREKVHLWGLNGQQEILIDSTKAAEKVRITDKAGQVLLMDAAPGREKISMVNKSGQRFLMDAAATRIGLTDRAGSEVLLEGASGNVLVRSRPLSSQRTTGREEAQVPLQEQAALAGLDHNFPVSEPVSVGGLSPGEGRRQSARAARPRSLHAVFRPHQQGKAPRCARARHAIAQPRLHCRHGPRVQRL